MHEHESQRILVLLHIAWSWAWTEKWCKIIIIIINKKERSKMDQLNEQQAFLFLLLSSGKFFKTCFW